MILKYSFAIILFPLICFSMTNKEKGRPTPITIWNSATAPLGPLSIDFSPEPALRINKNWHSAYLDAKGNIIDIDSSTTYTPYATFNLLKHNAEEQKTLPDYIWQHVLLCMKFQGSCVTETGAISSPHTSKVLSFKKHRKH